MSQPLAVLGGITAEQFLSEYWQKPLLVRNACPKLSIFLNRTMLKNLRLKKMLLPV